MRAFMEHADIGKGLPVVTPLATKYSVLTTQSLDVPRRALLCGVDDSRRMAAQAMDALASGDREAEEAFLAHCEGAADTLAFMLARRSLMKKGIELSDKWLQVFDSLEKGTKA